MCVTMHSIFVLLSVIVVTAGNVYRKDFYRSGLNYDSPYEFLDRSAVRRPLRQLNGENRAINQRSVNVRGDMIIRRQLFHPQRDVLRPFQNDRQVFENRRYTPEINPVFAMDMNQGYPVYQMVQNRNQRRLLKDVSNIHRQLEPRDMIGEMLVEDNRRKLKPNNPDVMKNVHRQGEEHKHDIMLHENHKIPMKEQGNQQIDQNPLNNNNKHSHKVNIPDEPTTLSPNSQKIQGNNGDGKHDTQKNDSNMSSNRDQTDISKESDIKERKTNTHVLKKIDGKDDKDTGVTGDRWSWGIVNDTKVTTNKNGQAETNHNAKEQGTNSGHGKKPDDRNSSGSEVESTTVDVEFPDRGAFDGDKCPTGQVRYSSGVCVDIDR